MRNMLLAAVAAASLASGASAASFTYSATFDYGSAAVNVITGSFDGDLNGNVITNLSNITAILNGVAFNGSGSLQASHFDTNYRGFVSGGGVASLDGTENNFVFMDSDFQNYNPSNYYFSLIGPNSGDFGDRAVMSSNYGSNSMIYNYGSSRSTTFTATQVNAAVPEPASWAMFISGFGLIGATMRRKKAYISFA